MKLALFGATGTTGSALLTQALDAGHSIRVLARTPEKIGLTDDALTITAGDAKDPAAVRATIAGCDAVLSALGGFADTDSLRIGIQVIEKAMVEAGVRRLIVVQGFHLDFPGDPHNLGRKTILPLLWLGSRSLIRDSRSMARSIQASDLDWTVIRAPRITQSGRTGNARVGYLKLGPFNSVSNADIAELALSSLLDTESFRTAPMIANGGASALGAAAYWVLGRRPAPTSQPGTCARRQ